MSEAVVSKNEPWYTELIGESEVRGDGALWQKVLGVDGNEYWRVTNHARGDHSQPNELIYSVKSNGSGNESRPVSENGYFKGGVPDISFQGWSARRDLRSKRKTA